MHEKKYYNMGCNRLLNKESLLLFIGILFSVILSILYSVKILSIEVIFIIMALPPLLYIFFAHQEIVLFALIAAYFGVEYFSSGLVTQGLIRGLFLSLIGLALLLKSGAARSITRIRTPIDRLLILCSIVVFLAFIYGFYFKHNDIRYLIGDLYKFVEIIFVFWLTTFILKEEKQVKSLILGFFLLFVLLGIVDVIIFFKRAQILRAALESRVRAGAQFSSVFALIMCAALMLYEKRRKIKIVLILLSLCFFVSFLLCFLRTGYIALPLTLAFLLFLYFYKEKRDRLKGVGKLLILLFALLLFIGLFDMVLTKNKPNINIIKATVTRFNTLINPRTTNPMGVRTFEIKSIISQVLNENPLLGNGLGGQYYSFNEFPEGWRWGIKHYVHNNYFDFIVRTGIIGLIILALFAFRYLKDAIGFYLKSKNELYKGFLLGFIGIFISSCIIAFSCSIFYSPFLFVIMAMTYSVAYFEEINSG